MFKVIIKISSECYYLCTYIYKYLIYGYMYIHVNKCSYCADYRNTQQTSSWYNSSIVIVNSEPVPDKNKV